MSKKCELVTAQDYAKEIIKKFDSIAGKYSAVELFNDWLEGQACCLNSFTGLDSARYKQYLIKAHEEHTHEMNCTYNEIFALLQEGLQKTREDILGLVFMSMNPSKKLGQFFTPACVCKLIAELTTVEETVKKEIEEKGYTSVADQCCGAGAILIADVEVLLSKGIDIDSIKVLAGDIDIRCAQMAAIQLSLLDYDAVILRQDALLLDEPYVYSTMRHMINEKGMDYFFWCNVQTQLMIEAVDYDFRNKKTA